MSMQSIPKKVDMKSKDMAAFLEPRAPSKMDIFKGIQTNLEKAIDEPDRRAPADPIPIKRVEPEVPTAPAVQEEVQPPGIEEVAPPASHPIAETAMQIDVRELKRAPAVRTMVEKTFSIDQDQYKMIVRISNLEGLRLERGVPASEILRHLLDHAMAQVDLKTGEVIPTSDGKGLTLPERRAGQ